MGSAPTERWVPVSAAAPPPPPPTPTPTPPTSMPAYMTHNDIWLLEKGMDLAEEHLRKLGELRTDRLHLSSEFYDSLTVYRDAVNQAKGDISVRLWRVLGVFGSFGLTAFHLLKPGEKPGANGASH